MFLQEINVSKVLINKKTVSVFNCLYVLFLSVCCFSEKKKGGRIIIIATRRFYRRGSESGSWRLHVLGAQPRLLSLGDRRSVILSQCCGVFILYFLFLILIDFSNWQLDYSLSSDTSIIGNFKVFFCHGSKVFPTCFVFMHDPVITAGATVSKVIISLIKTLSKKLTMMTNGNKEPDFGIKMLKKETKVTQFPNWIFAL